MNDRAIDRLHVRGQMTAEIILYTIQFDKIRKSPLIAFQEAPTTVNYVNVQGDPIKSKPLF